MLARRRRSLTQRDEAFCKKFSESHNYELESVRELFREMKQYMLIDADEREQEVRSGVTQKNSGILAIDMIFGGLPPGIIQIYGPPDSYKTSLLVYLACALEGDSVYVNADNKDIPWILNEDIVFVKGSPRANEIIKDLVSYEAADNVFIDSLPALVRYESFMRTCIRLISDMPNMSIIFSNQTRTSLYTKQSEPTLTDFIHSISSVILQVVEIKSYFGGKRVTYESRGRGGDIGFTLCYNTNGSLSNELYLLDLAIAKGHIVRTGALFKVPGLDNERYTLQDLLQSREILQQIWEKIFEGYVFQSNSERYLGRQLTSVAS